MVHWHRPRGQVSRDTVSRRIFGPQPKYVGEQKSVRCRSPQSAGRDCRSAGCDKASMGKDRQVEARVDLVSRWQAGSTHRRWGTSELKDLEIQPLQGLRERYSRQGCWCANAEFIDASLKFPWT